MRIFISTVHNKRGPFVYRLGRQVFNLERGVRLPYGLPLNLCKLFILLNNPQGQKTLPTIYP